MYTRRLLHHGPDPTAAPISLSDRAIAGCWFELHRRGGCGAGEIVLRDDFPLRQGIEIGDWISFELAQGERWYLGRVEERRAASPAEIRLRLEGMGIELSEVFPGGFAEDANGVPPHRFAATDLFSNDPDWSLETVDSLASAEQLVHQLLERYVAPRTHIIYDPHLIETPRHPAPLTSLKFRGEESVAAILKELGLRAQAAWGVDARGRFFFLQSRNTGLASWREGRDVTSLHETRDREHLFNRILLTGDYIYDQPLATDEIARRSFRWRGNYTQPDSRALYGDRRIRLWIPWLRTPEDSLAFVREFFRIYSFPTARYQIETLPSVTLPLPWEGRVRLEDREGHELFVGAIESLRVQFDHAPQFKLDLGPEDPRNLWPEPPHDERWETPQQNPAGGQVSMTTQSFDSSDFTLGTTSAHSSTRTSDGSSLDVSSASSARSSDLSWDESTDASSDDWTGSSAGSSSASLSASSEDSSWAGSESSGGASGSSSGNSESNLDSSDNGSLGGSSDSGAFSSGDPSSADSSDSNSSGDNSSADSSTGGLSSGGSQSETGTTGSSADTSTAGSSSVSGSSTDSGLSTASSIVSGTSTAGSTLTSYHSSSSGGSGGSSYGSGSYTYSDSES